MKDLHPRNARILIIDDQEANVLFLEGLLEEGGYTAWRTVRDSRAAVAICAEFQPDLILLDLIMPHLDGFGVLDQLRPYLAEQVYLPILVLTVDITPESRRRALAGGAKDFLAKPLDALEVLLRVKNLLETRFLYLQLQQRADERIREQAALIDQANDAILVCDLEDRLTFWNRGAEVLYGWPAAEVQGRSAAEVLFKTRPPELEEANRAVRAAGKWEGELSQVTRDGREIVVASRWTLLGNAGGPPRSKLLINTDITEKKKAENKLLRAQRLENIGRLAGGIAHDLNNILTPLTGGIDLLQRSCTDPADRPLLATMRASVQRGAELVRQILTFARGLDGQRRLVQLSLLIDELVRLFRQTFPRSIQISVSVAGDLWLINADATQMHQILTNLCVNARDAMPNGGRLRITARNQVLDEKEAGELDGLAVGRYVVLEVEDSGTGIPAAARDRIFEPFFTTKEFGKGTGLGLSTTLDIVRNHGGRIRVESEEGKGTRFVVYLPAQDAPGGMLGEQDRRELPAGKEELVLVIDDEAAMLQIAKLTLTSAGYRVLTALSGGEGVTLYAQQPREIDLVVTDLAMPGMDGAAVIHALQRLNPAVRILVVSGLVAGAETGQAVVAGVKGFLPKPYTVEALLASVRSILEA
jgi:two-component system, cell cycle sensor histidine kinase and response regulator CckA